LQGAGRRGGYASGHDPGRGCADGAIDVADCLRHPRDVVKMAAEIADRRVPPMRGGEATRALDRASMRRSALQRGA
jgi:hypothetical protein